MIVRYPYATAIPFRCSAKSGESEEVRFHMELL
jgi:hypothetical protein